MSPLHTTPLYFPRKDEKAARLPRQSGVLADIEMATGEDFFIKTFRNKKKIQMKYMQPTFSGCQRDSKWLFVKELEAAIVEK